MQSFQVDGCELHFQEHGDRRAPAVVLSHGAVLDAESWAAQAPVLARHYRVITWDMRGHGASQPLEGKLTFSRAAEDLRMLLDHLEIGRAALVGLSLGSFVSQEFGYRHPERVAALASIGATSLTGLKLSVPMAWALAGSDLILKLYPYSRLIEATAKGAAIRPETQDYIRRTVRRLSKQSYIAIWSAVQTGQRREPDYREPFPLLISVGEKDDIGVTRRGAIDWGESRPEAEFHVIPKAGHCANQDNPDYTTRMLVDFLGRHWPGKDG